MLQEIDIDWYRARLKVIEEEFGPSWLRRKARNGIRDHAIPGLWRAAASQLSSSTSVASLNLTVDLADLFDVACDLEIARTLPGYGDAITPEKLKNRTYEKECYVAHVASLATGSNYSTSFVPESRVKGIRTPDLSISDGSGVLDVECKRKDNYTVEEDGAKAWTQLTKALGDAHRSLRTDHEVIVCAIGALPCDSIQILSNFIRERLTAGDEGEFESPVDDCVVLIRGTPPQNLSSGLWISSQHNPATATATFRLDAAGKMIRTPMLQLYLHIIDANKLHQVLSSFASARGQIDVNRGGLVYIGVDTTKLSTFGMDVYFRVLEQEISRQFKPDQNTRIAAVVLTGSSIGYQMHAGEGRHYSIVHRVAVRNPYRSGADRIRIPGCLWPIEPTQPPGATATQ